MSQIDIDSAGGVTSHNDLTDVTANQHHSESHSHASHTGIGTDDHHAQVHTHASHTGIGVNDHHNQQHALNGADHTGEISDTQHGSRSVANAHAHSQLSGVTANQHHNQSHGASDHDRTVVDPYLIPIEDQFNLTTEFLFRSTAILDNGFNSFLSTGTVGGGFGNDDGVLTVNSGTGANNYATLAICSPTGTFRVLALSATPQRFKFKFNSNTSVLQNIKIIGLASTTTMGTGYQTAGANTGCFFRIDSAAAAVNFFAVTKDGAGAGNETTTDTAILDRVAASSSDFYTIEIVATNSSVSYYMSLGANTISPTLIATHTTNIPTGTLGIVIGSFSKTALGAHRTIDCRWLKFKSARTNVL